MTEMTKDTPVPALPPSMEQTGWIAPVDIHIRIEFPKDGRKVYMLHLERLTQRLMDNIEAQLGAYRYPYDIEKMEGRVSYGYVKETTLNMQDTEDSEDPN